MKITMATTVLKNQLYVEISDGKCPEPEASIVEGCAVLWGMQWLCTGGNI